MKVWTDKKGAYSLEATLSVSAVLLILFFVFQLLSGAAAESRYLGAVDRTASELALLSPLAEHLPQQSWQGDEEALAQETFMQSDLWQTVGMEALLSGGLADLALTQAFGPLILSRIDHWYRQDESLPPSVLDQVRRPRLHISMRQDRQQLWLGIAFEIATPLGPIPRFRQAIVPLWTGSGTIAGEEGDADGIWLLDNFSRGRLLRDHYGANLPYDFPAIARFAGGQALAITSVDLTAPSYASESEIRRRIERSLSRLAEFSGAHYRRGETVIRIESMEIESKTLLLVVPENRPAASESVLRELEATAAAQGMTLQVTTHGQSHRYLDPADAGRQEKEGP